MDFTKKENNPLLDESFNLTDLNDPQDQEGEKNACPDDLFSAENKNDLEKLNYPDIFNQAEIINNILEEDT